MFEPSIRESAEEIKQQALSLLQSSAFNRILDHIPNMVIIMNSRRQIVYMNKKFAGLLSESSSAKLGCRPGECMLCVHAAPGKDGCGSTEFCHVCGLAQAIRKSEKGIHATGECNIPLAHGESYTFRVNTRPFKHEGKPYIFIYLQDISDYKTREMLENVFLHDINNSITALNGLNELIDDIPLAEVKNIINDLSIRLTDEIYSFRLITDAENRSLSILVTEVDIDKLIENIIRSLVSTRNLRNRKIRNERSGLKLQTDETLLRRVMINTIKNALEASSDIEEVKIYCEKGLNGELNRINIKSYPLIPKKVQLQLFQRAFSTKGAGRGWGTYSIRLLTERYLGGTVSFVSDNRHRTIFTISIPSLLSHKTGLSR